MRERWRARGRGRAWLAGLAGAVLAAAAPASDVEAPAAAASVSDVEALLASAGAIRHLEAWPETNVTAREAARASLPPELSALLLYEVRGAFAPEVLLADVSRRIAGSLEPRAVAELRLRYDASGAAGLLGPPSGIPVSALRDFPRFASTVSRQEVPPARFRLVAKLSEATGLGHNAWRASAAVGRAIARGAAVLRCETDPDPWSGPPPPEEVERSLLAGPFQERVQLELLFLTRERDVPDLRRAVRFLESPPARDLHRALEAAISQALDAALARLRARLAAPASEHCG